MKLTYYIFLYLTFALFPLPLLSQQLSFYDVRPSRENVQPNPPITNYTIGQDKDLYLLLVPDISLEAQLLKLAPGVKREEILNKGNYTLAFLVDGKSVYAEKLHPGMILEQDKLAVKPLDIVFVSSSRSGIWSINLWERFLAKAGVELFGKTPRVLTVVLSAYVEDKGLTVSPVLAQADLNVNLVLPVIDPETMLPQKIAASSGFAVSTDRVDEELIIALNTKIAQKAYRMINGIVVLKNGKLLLEQYYNGESRSTLHDPRSVSKSVTSTLVGMAIKDGFIESENQTLAEFYDLRKYENYSPKKAQVKLVDLLSMSSAFDGNDEVDASPGNEENMYPTADYIKFTLDLPMLASVENGKRWSYFTAGTNLLMDILDKKIPEGIAAYAQRRLFEPLGVEKVEWARTPQGKPFGGGGLRMRALDFAKYGQLYANQGIFNGKRIVEKSWVTKSFSPLQVLPSDRAGFYGLLFWNKVFSIKGKNYEVYYSTGNGGNKIYVFKNVPLVIVITASAYGRSFAHPQVDEIMEKYLLPAVLD